MDNMSLSDIAAVTRGAEDFNGGGSMWFLAIILILLISGGGAYGAEDDVEFYYRIAKNFIHDEDAQPHKLAKYFKR